MGQFLVDLKVYVSEKLAKSSAGNEENLIENRRGGRVSHLSRKGL